MIVKPTVTDLLEKSKNRYELVIATSKRARQIAMGDEPLTKVKEETPVTLAANEIAEGKVTIIRDDEEVKQDETKEVEKIEKSEDDEKKEETEGTEKTEGVEGTEKNKKSKK